MGNGGLLELALGMQAEAPVWVLGEVWGCTVIKAQECTDEAQSFHRMTCSEQQILMENPSLIVMVKTGWTGPPAEAKLDPLAVSQAEVFFLYIYITSANFSADIIIKTFLANSYSFTWLCHSLF